MPIPPHSGVGGWTSLGEVAEYLYKAWCDAEPFRAEGLPLPYSHLSDSAKTRWVRVASVRLQRDVGHPDLLMKAEP